MGLVLLVTSKCVYIYAYDCLTLKIRKTKSRIPEDFPKDFRALPEARHPARQ